MSLDIKHKAFNNRVNELTSNLYQLNFPARNNISHFEGIMFLISFKDSKMFHVPSLFLSLSLQIPDGRQRDLILSYAAVRNNGQKIATNGDCVRHRLSLFFSNFHNEYFREVTVLSVYLG